MIEKTVFVHHVYFWLNNPSNKEEQAQLIKGLNILSGANVINGFHIGLPADTNREVIDSSYDISWLLIFKNKEDQDIYQTHPLHLQFVADCAHLWSKVVVYDTIGI